MRFRCDEWLVDAATREIKRGAEAVHVSPKAFELLTTLIAERPRAVSKPELLRRLWPATFVTEANLANLVAEARSALGDAARRPRYIRTVQRHGYAFCGAVIEEASPAGPVISLWSCRLIWGKREVALNPGENMLGRTHEAAAWIEAESVSRRHARVVVSGQGASIEDLGSKNGTFLNGTRVTGPRSLSDRDEIRLGSVRLTFRIHAPPFSTASHPDA
jgi:DNA-binding winged helix-turn-helix (wHTH) protein